MNWLFHTNNRKKAGNDVINIFTSEDTEKDFPRVLDVVSYEFHEWCIFQLNTGVYII